MDQTHRRLSPRAKAAALKRADNHATWQLENAESIVRKRIRDDDRDAQRERALDGWRGED